MSRSRLLRPTRESFIKQGALVFTDKLSDAVAYVWNSEGPSRKGGTVPRYHARVFFGKAAKPAVNYYYTNAAQREQAVKLAFEGRRSRTEMMDKIKAERQAPNQLQVGDILNSMTSYSMTSYTFYQVVEVTGQHVSIRKIAQITTSTHRDGGTTVPVPNKFIGEAERKLVQNGTRVKVDYKKHANKWDGKPKNYTDMD